LDHIKFIIEFVDALQFHDTDTSASVTVRLCFCNSWHSTFYHIWSHVTWRGHHRPVTTGTF